MRWPWSPRRSSQRLMLRRVGAQHAFVLTDGPPGDEPVRLLRWGLLADTRPVPSGDAIALLEGWGNADAKAAEPPLDYPKDHYDILGLGLYTLALAKEQMGLLEDALGLYKRAVEACGRGFAQAGETAESARMAIARSSRSTAHRIWRA